MKVLIECPKCLGRIPYKGEDPYSLIDTGIVLVCPDCRQRWMLIYDEEVKMPLIKESPQDKRFFPPIKLIRK